MEERDPYLNNYKDIRITDSREDYWRCVAGGGKGKSNIHSLRCDVETKDEYKLIERESLVVVMYKKMGVIV